MTLKSLGKLALGAYSVHAGLKMLGDATAVLMGGGAGLGSMRTVDAPPAPATRGRTGGMTRSHYVVRNIDERVAVLQQLVVTGRTDPVIRKFTVQALSKRCGDKWCVTENDEWAEVNQVCAAIRKRYRYVHDEYGRDLFQAPRRTLELGGGDCDDQTSLTCACLGSIGFPTGARVVQTHDASTWNHIYALVGLPKARPTRWVPIDLSVPGKPPGWEVSRNELVAVRDYAFR